MHPKTKKIKKKKRSVAVEDSMCEGVIIGILSRLPVKSLLRFKSVCKAWRTLIEEPFFVQENLEQSQRRLPNIIFRDCGRLYSLDIESSSLSCNGDVVKWPGKALIHNYLTDSSYTFFPIFLGSCNGLICIQTSHKDLHLLNPCTRTYTKLSNIFPVAISHVAIGFGYDAKIKDYKLVRITSSYSWRRSYCSEVSVLTLTLDSVWRRLSDVPYYVGSKAGKLVNGALYWITSRGDRKLVICFDVEEEEFRVVSHPVCKTGNRDRVLFQIAELGGCLSLVCLHESNDVEVWVMKEYGLEESWTKMFSIDPKRLQQSPDSSPDCYVTPICILKNNEGILFHKGNNLVLYKPKGNRYHHFHGVSLSLLGSVTYRGSLVYLDEKIPRH